MQYIDRIYGKNEISDPLALELMQCPALKRLKGVDQVGYQEPFRPGTRRTRFEHSVGVFLLLNKYGAPREEQIAGLIHDVSHTAFSHSIEYVLDEGSETGHTYQDSVFVSFIKSTEIPGILSKYGIDLPYILDDSHFPLKEKPLPDLCADRIDYSLRDAFIFKEITSDDVNYFLINLMTQNHLWVFKNVESARKYAKLFVRLNAEYYADFQSAVMFRTLGDYLRYALKQQYITKDDFFRTDNYVLSKISNHLETDETLKLMFDRVNNKVEARSNHEQYDSRVSIKSRVVDPLCYHEGTIHRFSALDAKWSRTIERESKPKEYFIQFEK